jgi:hypothetical protein
VIIVTREVITAAACGFMTKTGDDASQLRGSGLTSSESRYENRNRPAIAPPN